MTQTEALRMALEALDGLSEPYDVLKAQEAIREALAQPDVDRRSTESKETFDQQEPVAWGVFDGPNLHDVNFTEEEAHEMVRLKGDGSVVKFLYTSTQPQMQPCAGRNCGSTDPNLHSAECFEDYEKSTGMNQRKPLSDEEIAVIAAASGGLASDFVVSVARAIEAAHGIKE